MVWICSSVSFAPVDFTHGEQIERRQYEAANDLRGFAAGAAARGFGRSARHLKRALVLFLFVLVNFFIRVDFFRLYVIARRKPGLDPPRRASRYRSWSRCGGTGQAT